MYIAGMHSQQDEMSADGHSTNIPNIMRDSYH